MEAFSAIIGQHVFVFLFVFFLAGIIVGALGVKKGGGEKRSALLQKPSDYILGMYSLFTGENETAIKKLSGVVEKLPDAVEVYLALGNLYRNRGQLEKAIKVHKDLLKRSQLSNEERVLALDALGTDYRVGGFLERAHQTFRDALALNPKDTYALAQLVKLSEDRNEWDKAYEYARELFKKSRLVDSKTLSYHLVKKGEALAEEGKHFKAALSFKKAIRLLPDNTLAYLSLMKLYLKEGKLSKAQYTFEQVVEKYPYKTHLFFPLLDELYPAEKGFDKLDAVRRIALQRHQKRALVLYLDEAEKEGRTEEVKSVIEDLAKHFPRSRVLQKRLFKLIAEEKLDLDFVRKTAASLSREKDLSDPFVCIYCGYKTQDILPRCPNCKEWNSFADSEN